jgi:ankyrin repeat protein
MFIIRYVSCNLTLRRNFLGGLLFVVLAILTPSTGIAGAYDDFFRAAQADGADEIKSLLRRGLDPNLIEGERGETGLMLALRFDSMKVFEILINARGIDLETRARNGDTALMIAAFKGNKAAVKALLAKNVEPNQTGWTALHYAAASGQNEIVQMLLDKAAYIDAESPNKTTPIMMAAQGGHILTVKLLLDEGADATLRNEQGWSAVDFARKFGHDDIADGLNYRLKKAGKPR